MTALAAAAAMVLLAGAGLWSLQRRLVYFPDGREPSIDVMGEDWEAVSFVTGDGLTLAAWLRAPKEGRPLVLVFNGNAGNRGDRAALGTGLAAGGLGVLLTDYRGYGGNPGRPSEAGLALDAAAALAFAHRRAPGAPVVYFGESLGAAVAIGLAAAEPPAALVLRSPFTSLAAVGREHYPWLPVAGLLRDRYPSLERIASVQAPTLVIAGDADSIVPVEQSRLIHAAATGRKELLIIPGADHNDPALVSGGTVVDAVVAFLVAVE